MSNSIVVDDVEVDGSVETDESNEVAASTEDDFSMPEKFADKSAEQVAQSYAELEKELGRKNNEVGELRKLTDQYIHQELTSRNSREIEDPKPDAGQIEVDDLLEDPTRVVGSVVDSKLEAIKRQIAEEQVARKTEKFLSDNPDYEDISKSKEFYNWANASEYRNNQLSAAKSGDLAAASDILQGYRDQAQALTEAAKKGEQKKIDQQLADATTETSGTGSTPNKVFKRTQLMDMYINRPDEYERMRPEIEQAYAENRVK
jgi:hypothetical protein